MLQCLAFSLMIPLINASQDKSPLEQNKKRLLKELDPLLAADAASKGLGKPEGTISVLTVLSHVPVLKKWQTSLKRTSNNAAKFKAKNRVEEALKETTKLVYQQACHDKNPVLCQRLIKKFPHWHNEFTQCTAGFGSFDQVAVSPATYQEWGDLEAVNVVHAAQEPLPPNWNEAKAETGQMFYYKHDATCLKLYPANGPLERLKGTFLPPAPAKKRKHLKLKPGEVPPPPSKPLIMPTPPGPDGIRGGYPPASSTWIRPTGVSTCPGNVGGDPLDDPLFRALAVYKLPSEWYTEMSNKRRIYYKPDDEVMKIKFKRPVALGTKMDCFFHHQEGSGTIRAGMVKVQDGRQTLRQAVLDRQKIPLAGLEVNVEFFGCSNASCAGHFGSVETAYDEDGICSDCESPWNYQGKLKWNPETRGFWKFPYQSERRRLAKGRCPCPPYTNCWHCHKK